MKKLYCKDYDVTCCDTCHSTDQFFSTSHKGYEVSHCCKSYVDICQDINKHLDEPLENGCGE